MKNLIGIDPESAAVDVDSLASIVMIVCLGAFGSAILLEAPVLVGSMVTQLGFSEAQAGYAMSADLGGMGLASIPALLWVQRANWRIVALVAFSAMIAGNLATIFIQDFQVFTAVRLLTGTAAGTCMILCVTSISLMRDPDRGYGFLVMGNLIFQTVAIVVLARILPVVGLGFAYGTNAIAMLVFTFLIRYLPAHGKRTSAADVAAPREHTRLIWGVLGLLAMLAYYIGVTGVWTYLERIGDSAGLDAASIGNALAISSLLGLAGATLAAAIAGRFGRSLPVVAGHVFTIAGIALLTTSLNYSTYLAAVCIYNFAWNFLLPYLLACIAAVDVSGRLIASTNGFIGAGLGLGPAIVATIYTPGNYAPVLWVCCACVTLSLLFIFRLAIR